MVLRRQNVLCIHATVLETFKQNMQHTDATHHTEHSALTTIVIVSSPFQSPPVQQARKGSASNLETKGTDLDTSKHFLVVSGLRSTVGPKY